MPLRFYNTLSQQVEEFLRRGLRASGFTLDHVMNITDVDDKIIRNALAQQKPLSEYTAHYTQAFLDDGALLRWRERSTWCPPPPNIHAKPGDRGGCVSLLMLLSFYWLVEVRGYRKWTFPLVVVGADSIFMYIAEPVVRFGMDKALGAVKGEFAPVAQSCAVLLITWYLCYWLYRRKIFFKL